MSGVFQLQHIGRFGNQLFSYCFARGYCEKHGLELHTDPWVGEQIFQLSHPRCEGDLPRRDENTLNFDGEANVSYLSYSQRQKCADFYSRSQIADWLNFRGSVRAALQLAIPDRATILMHLRRGDYAGAGYPLISHHSYDAAIIRYASLLNLTGTNRYIQEEYPKTHPKFTGELSFVPDFFILAHAAVLFRANSSFSFWAGAIGEALHGAQVFSPVIEGLKGGVEHDCQFIPGNHARLADLPFVEEIRIKP